MHKKVIIPIIVVLVSAFVTFAFLMVRSDKTISESGNKPVTTNTQKPVNGLYSYASKVYSFSFQYPEQYVLDEKNVSTTKEKRHTFTLITQTDKELMNAIGNNTDAVPTSITIDVFPEAATTQDVPTWVKNNAASNFKLSKNKVLATTTLAGIPAYAYTWDGLFGANSVAFAYKGNIIVASMTYITAQDVIWKDFGTVLQSIKLQ
jgi:hypothetical protein